MNVENILKNSSFHSKIKTNTNLQKTTLVVKPLRFDFLHLQVAVAYMFPLRKTHTTQQPNEIRTRNQHKLTPD